MRIFDLYERVIGKPPSKSIDIKGAVVEISETLKRKIPVSQVVSIDRTLKPRGQDDFVSQENPSLHVHDSKGMWVWYSQQGKKGDFLGGDIFNWRSHMHGESWLDAAETLAGVDCKTIRNVFVPVQKTYKKYSETDLELVESAHRRCLNSQSYLDKWMTKGINRDMVIQNKFGWIEGFKWWDDDMVEQCNDAGLIPFFDSDGKLINLQVRLFGECNGARYRPFKSGYGTSVFNGGLVDDDVVIVEGAIKATILSSNGFICAGIPAVRNFSACGMMELLDERNVKRIYVWLDPMLKNGKGGYQPHETLKWVKAQSEKREVYMVKTAMKPDEFVLMCGASAASRVIQYSMRLI